jgi:hypothetical protein
MASGAHTITPHSIQSRCNDTLCRFSNKVSGTETREEVLELRFSKCNNRLVAVSTATKSSSSMRLSLESQINKQRKLENESKFFFSLQLFSAQFKKRLNNVPESAFECCAFKYELSDDIRVCLPHFSEEISQSQQCW